MSARALATWRELHRVLPAPGGGAAFRLAALSAAGAVLLAQEDLRTILLQGLSDAYLQVSVFVAATFGLLQILRRLTGQDLGQVLDRLRAWQVPLAAALGALPGCGGAVVVVSQFVQGRISFGALVAVLTATMGDAAFLLLAREPLTGLGVFAVSWVVGVVSGVVVDRIHRPGFAVPDGRVTAIRLERPDEPLPGPLLAAWTAVLMPGLVLGLLEALQIEASFSLVALGMAIDPAAVVGPAGALLSLALWAFAPGGDDGAQTGSGIAQVAQGTSFVTLWVVLGYLAFDLGTHATGFDLAGLFTAWAPLVPLLAVLVGFLPGCGPQIIVTGLYLEGSLPLSAQLGNAISNDGDALFPALALAPRAALLATLYSAVPALIVAYGFYAWFE